jgi:hypothetical protein
MKNGQKVMKDIGLNDPITVTLPAHLWLSFAVTYASSGWGSSSANSVCSAVVDQLFNPLYLNETQAEAQQMQDQQEMAIKALFGQPPDIPPNMEEE